MKLVTIKNISSGAEDVGWLGYAAWCWKQPVYFGLPLILLVPILMVFDLAVLISCVVTNWGKVKWIE